MNILFVAQRYHPFMGGVETQTRLVANDLAREHRVSVAAVNFKHAQISPRLAELEDSLLAPHFGSYRDGAVEVHSLTPSLTDQFRMLPIALRVLPRIRRHYYHGLRTYGYRWYRSVYKPKLRKLMSGVDVVHSVAGGYLGWAAQEAAKDLGIPFVCTPYVHPGQHGDDAPSVAYYRRSDAVFALLETDRRFLLDLGVPEEKIHISGVVPLLPAKSDPEGFRQRHGLTGKPVVLYVGRVEAYKGARSLLDAAGELWESLPDAQIIFIGPAGAEQAAWFAGADPRIKYLGLVSEQEKADALAACDVFCMPSMFEILPAVYLEAWSYGKAVVGGKANGLPELIEGNHAGITVPQVPHEIARQLTTLLQDDAARLRCGENGRALVAQRYSREALMDVFTSVYKQITGRANVPSHREAERGIAV